MSRQHMQLPYGTPEGHSKMPKQDMPSSMVKRYGLATNNLHFRTATSLLSSQAL